MGKLTQTSKIGAAKRPRTEVPLLTVGHEHAKYVVLSATKKDEPLGKMSPFFIQKAISSLLSNIKEIKKMSSGDLLVKCPTKHDCDLLLSTTNLLGKEVSASLHKALNTSRGVISMDELVSVPEEEILEGLKGEGVIEVRKIKIRKNNEYTITRNVVLTFNQPVLPEQIHVGYLVARVRPYIPNPLRCFRCNRFGHAAGTCRGSPCCARCGNKEHETTECKGPDHCVNCSGAHPAYSRSCPKWKVEKEILTVKVTEKLSYPEARRRVSPFILHNKTDTFSEVVRAGVAPQRKSVGTQTCIQVSELPQPTPMHVVGSTQVCAAAPAVRATSTTPLRPPRRLFPGRTTSRPFGMSR